MSRWLGHKSVHPVDVGNPDSFSIGPVLERWIRGALEALLVDPFGRAYTGHRLKSGLDGRLWAPIDNEVMRRPFVVSCQDRSGGSWT